MADIFVRKTGNDTTGDGATGNPYLTIAKAESVAAAGDRIIVGAGAYSENNGTGRLTFDQHYATPVTVYPETGELESVKVSGSSQRIVISGSGLRFHGITFQGVSGQNTIVQFTGTTSGDVHFVDCDFIISSSATSQSAVGSTFQTDGGAHEGIEFLGGRIRQIGTHSAQGIFFDGKGVGTLDGLVIRDMVIRTANYPVRLGQGITNLDAGNLDLLKFGDYEGHTFLLGVDGQSGALSSGRIANVRAWNQHGHTMILGAGVNGADILDCEISGGVNPEDALDLGLVLKQCQNVTVRRATIDARNAAAAYFKAATDCQIFDSDITVARHADGSGIRADKDNVNNDANTRVVARGNRIRATVGKALDLANSGASDDAGGSVVDDNVYDISGSATFGDVYGTTGITTLRALRAAWSTYDQPNNDRNSKASARVRPNGGVGLASLPA